MLDRTADSVEHHTSAGSIASGSIARARRRKRVSRGGCGADDRSPASWHRRIRPCPQRHRELLRPGMARPAHRRHRQPAAARLAFLRRPELFEPHPPDRVSQRRRPARLRPRHPLSHPVPRRTDRCAGAEPDRPGRDHRRGHRRVGDGGDRRHHHRSRPAAGTAGRRELRPQRRCAVRLRISGQSGAGRAAAAAADHADQDARAHL